MKNVRVFWSLFYRIRTEYRDLHGKSPYSVRMQENANQKIPIRDSFYTVAL